MTTAHKAASKSAWLEQYFKINERGSSIRQETIAGFTTFLAMVYSVAVVPSMLSKAGFDASSVYIAACLIAAFGSLIMGLWANLPMAIGCAISLTAFTAFSLVIGQGLSIPVALGAIFLMGVLFTIISVTGIRQWILSNLPKGIAHGTGIGIGLFLLLIATDSVKLIVANTSGGLPITLGDVTSLPVIASVVGLAAIIGLERNRVPGGILLVIVFLSIFGLIFDDSVEYTHFFEVPNINSTGSFFGQLDIMGAINPVVLPIVLALVMTAIFDATGTIRAVAEQAELLDKDDEIISGGKALTTDSVSNIFASFVGGAPAAVYIESAAGTAAGGRTGLTATIVGLLFVVIIFFAPLAALVPDYATAPALMYVGLLMLSNVTKLNFKDPVDAMAGLTCAVFIVLSSNIVTGIMLGFATLTIGRLFSGEWRQLKPGIVIIAVALVAFYMSGWAI